jgi:hypothetical protein
MPAREHDLLAAVGVIYPTDDYWPVSAAHDAVEVVAAALC